MFTVFKVFAGLVLFTSSVFGQTSDSAAPKLKPSGLFAPFYNKVHTDFAVTWDGEEIFLAKSDIEVHLPLGSRVEGFIRVNLLPYAGKTKIIEVLRQNEDIIHGVSAAIAQAVRNQIAVQMGIPVASVTVPQQVLQAAIAQHLAVEVENLISNKITSDAQFDAALRELGLAVTIVNNPGHQVIAEVGKLDPMYAKNEGYFQNYFRLSRPAVRLKYAKVGSGKLGFATYMEVGNDNGLWEIANPQGNASREYISSIIARSSGSFFDLTNANSWEIGLVKGKFLLAYGTRPVLERGVDSQYLLATYDDVLKGYQIEAQGSLESFDDPLFGDTIVKRFELQVSRDIKGYDVSTKVYTRFDTLVRRNMDTIQAGVIKPLWNFSGFTLGVGGRAYTYRYKNNGLDAGLLEASQKWKTGGEVGAALTFGEIPVKASDVLYKKNLEENEKRLKEQKK